MSSPNIAYVIRMFPQLSETFIANEILELERLGLRLQIYSLRRPREEVPHEIIGLIRSRVICLPMSSFARSWQVLRANLALCRMAPARYLATLRYVVAALAKSADVRGVGQFVQATILAFQFKQNGVQHLHAHMAHVSTQVAMLASKLTGIPFSFTGHARDIYLTEPSKLAERINAGAFVVTCTNANAIYLKQLVEPDQRTKIKLRYHGVDLQKFRPRQDRVVSDLDPIILSAGRLVEKKGFATLLRACAILRDQSILFHCLIVGAGPKRRVLEDIVSNLNLQSAVSFHGVCSQEELLEIYLRATVFALPSQVQDDGNRDGIPNVLMEAMAVGLPVVATAVSGIPELINGGHDGLLIPERDPKALASALKLLLSDRVLREQLGLNGRRKICGGFDARENAQAVAKLFRDIGSW